jgi:hypothetical protein
MILAFIPLSFGSEAPPLVHPFHRYRDQTAEKVTADSTGGRITPLATAAGTVYPEGMPAHSREVWSEEPRLDRRDLLFAGTVSLLVVILGLLLYGLAWRVTPPGHRFSGFLHSSHDMYSYMAWARAFSEPGFLVDNPYTSTRHPGGYFNLYWFAVGKVMRLSGLPFLPVLYLFGCLSGGAMVLSFVAFARTFLRDRAAARFATLLALAGAGFGWVVMLFSPTFLGYQLVPLDITNPESYPLTAFLLFPHVSLSFALLTMILLLFHLGLEADAPGRTGVAALLLLALGFFHPYHLPTILAVALADTIWFTLRPSSGGPGRWRHPGLLFLGAVPPLLYFLHLFRTNPNFSLLPSQNLSPTQGPLPVLLGLAPALLLALAGVPLWRGERGNASRLLFLLSWVAVSLVLASTYPAIRFASRMIQGVVLPLSTLAAGGMLLLVRPATRSGEEAPRTFLRPPRGVPPPGEETAGRGFWLAAALILVLAVPSHGVTLANQILQIARKPYFFRGPLNSLITVGRDQEEALAFMERNVNDDGVVMSFMDTGVALPARARVRSYLGHFQGTPNASGRLADVTRFYADPGVSDMRRRWLAELNVDYVWFGPQEALSGGFNPLGVPYLERIFGNGTVSVFRVVHPPPGGASPRP